MKGGDCDKIKVRNLLIDLLQFFFQFLSAEAFAMIFPLGSRRKFWGMLEMSKTLATALSRIAILLRQESDGSQG